MKPAPVLPARPAVTIDVVTGAGAEIDALAAVSVATDRSALWHQADPTARLNASSDTRAVTDRLGPESGESVPEPCRGVKSAAAK